MIKTRIRREIKLALFANSQAFFALNNFKSIININIINRFKILMIVLREVLMVKVGVFCLFE